jgi:serine/threonine protein kinase
MTTDVGCVLLTGNGPSSKDGGWAFCSGGDQRIRGKDGYRYATGDTADTIEPGHSGRLHILEVQRLIRFMPKVVICLVNGWAAGGGHSLHVVCDLTLASREHARFKQTDADVGSFDGGYGWGVVHRNITPATIMLTDFLLPRVGEFEMSLPIGSGTGSSITFTPCYSPPEAVEPVEAAPTADVYGLGALLWALLAGRPPFTSHGERIDALTALDRARAENLAAPAPGTPEPIVELLRRSMAADPRNRPANGAAFVSELRRSVSRSEATAHRQTPSNGAQSSVTDIDDLFVTEQVPIVPAGSTKPTTMGSAVRSDARYILLLVALISCGVLGMVIAALLTGN